MMRKVLVIVVATVQLLVVSLLAIQTVRGWTERGWSGIAFNAAPRPEMEQATESLPFAPEHGRIIAVAPQSPAGRKGISEEETVLSVNGIELADLAGLRELAQTTTSGDTVTYRLERDGRSRDLSLQLESPFASWIVVASTTSTLAVGLVWLLISLLVFWSRPNAHTANIFFLLSSTGATLYFIWALGELSWPNLRGLMPTFAGSGQWFLLGGLTFFSILFTNFLLHLALVFPKSRPVVSSWPQVFIWIHTLPFLLFTTLAAMFGTARLTRSVPGLVAFEALAAVVTVVISIRLLRATRAEGLKQAVFARPFSVEILVITLACHFGQIIRLLPDSYSLMIGVVIGLTTAAYFVGCITGFSVFTWVALYRSYRESGSDVRYQVRWPLWGTLTAVTVSVVISVFSIGIGLLSPDLGISNYTFMTASNTITKIVYLLIPLSFAFAILKYRLLDIDIIIRKTVIYSGVTGIVLALYLGFAGISGLVLVRTAGLEGETATVFATLAVVALFVPIRNRFQAFVDRRFFQRERDLESAQARIHSLISNAVDLDEILPKLAEETQRALHTRSVAVFTCVDEELRLDASVGIPDEHLAPPTLNLGSLRLPPGASIVRTDDLKLTDDENIRALKRVRAAILAMVRRGSETIAMISSGPKLNRERFDEEDEAFLRMIADQLALAMGTAYQSRSQTELARAREIQQSLLPASLPRIDGVDVAARWKPAREVSGDYYDVLRLDQSRLAVCIGDVVGKGMPAALLMSSLQAALKAVAFQTPSPKSVCTQVRDVMLQSLSGGTFVTFFFCVVDREAARISYCNAGHNPPLLARNDGTLIKLDVGGPIFARIAADRPYQEASVKLGAGDRLVLYTDGVTEAEDGGGEMFEDWRLEELLQQNIHATAAELENSIAETVLEHARGKLQDDLTLVVMAID